MAYWEYEMTREEAIRINEEEQKQYDESNNGARGNDYTRSANNMMRDAQRSIKAPSMPPIPRINTPRI